MSERAHVGGAVEGELDGEDARAAADVQAALVGADALAEHVAPGHVAGGAGGATPGSTLRSGKGSG
jgi:hypothetical protein